MSDLTAQEREALETVRRFREEAYNKQNVDIVDELVAEGFEHHGPEETPPGRDGYKQFVGSLFESFPDATGTIEETVVDGDRVAVHYRLRGTHEGPLGEIPPTGKEITMEGVSIFRVVDGRIVEEWFQPDIMSVMQQLGVVPSS